MAQPIPRSHTPPEPMLSTPPRRRGAVRTLLGVVVLPILLGLIVLIVLANTAWGNERVRRLLVSQVNDRMFGHLAVGRLRGNLLSNATLTDVRLADSAGNDQAIVAQELQKIALYVEASPQAPKELDHNAVDAIGAENAEGDFQRLADLAMTGSLDELADELARFPAGGSEAIPVIRSLQRRLLMLAPLRARIERGERADGILASLGRSLFFKDKPKVQRMLSKWSAQDLATVADRAGKLERSLIFTAAPDREALGEELLAIARKARSL